MPTKREREYYRMGYQDGLRATQDLDVSGPGFMIAGGYENPKRVYPHRHTDITKLAKPKRKLSAWNKYVKANSKKPRFRYRNGKLNLKKMAVAFRKTPQGKKKRR